MIHLHIGRHKSGTTSLQTFFAANRDRLAERGVEYPEFQAPYGNGYAHHEVAYEIARQRRDRVRPADLPAALLGAIPVLAEPLARGCSNEAGSAVLFSSEAFQNQRANLVAAVFPPEVTRVMVYLREQVEYAITSWAQQVHASLETRSLEQFLEDTSVRYHYDDFLFAWRDAFGADAVVARTYDRAHLLGGDIRLDVLAQLGLDPDGFDIEDRDANPSIGGPLVGVKLALNRVLRPIDEDAAQRAMYQPLQLLAEETPRYRVRPVISAELQASLRALYQPSNDRIADLLNQPFTVKDVTGDHDNEAFHRDDLEAVVDAVRAHRPRFVAAEIEPHLDELRRLAGR